MIEVNRHGSDGERCWCVMCRAAEHEPSCDCAYCAAVRRLNGPPKVPRRLLVPSEDVAEHIRNLGVSQRRLAAATGLSAGVIAKASRPGNQLEEATARRILAMQDLEEPVIY